MLITAGTRRFSITTTSTLLHRRNRTAAEIPRGPERRTTALLAWHDPLLREGVRFAQIWCRDLPRAGGSIVFSPNILHFRGHCHDRYGRRGGGWCFLNSALVHRRVGRATGFGEVAMASDMPTSAQAQSISSCVQSRRIEAQFTT